LTLFGLPFNHNLFWLYVLPPGLLTWLATRPVLESKRLPELLISQVRYLGEPSTWCRMAPMAERDEIVVFGRVTRWVCVGGGMAIEPDGIEQREDARELTAPGRAALPVAAAGAQVVSGQPVAGQPAEQPVSGRARSRRQEVGRQGRGRQAKEQHNGERQGREDGPDRAEAGPGQGEPGRGAAGAADSRGGTACRGVATPASGTGSGGAGGGRGGAAAAGGERRLGHRSGPGGRRGGSPGRRGGGPAASGTARGTGRVGRCGWL